MKKIAILSMTCNKPFYQLSSEVIRQTIFKNVLDGKYSNIKFYSFTSSEDGRYHYSKLRHSIKVPCDDSLYGTAEKTIKTLKLLKLLKIDFDYVFLTNTSTFVNVTLLDKFIQTLYDNSLCWSEMIYSTDFASAPYNWCLQARGNGMILSREYVDILTDDFWIEKAFQEDKTRNKDAFFINDAFISLVLNTFSFLNKTDHSKHYRTYGKNDDVNKCIAFTIKKSDTNEDFRREFELSMMSYINTLLKDEINIEYIIDSIHNDCLIGDIPRKRYSQFLREKSISDIPYIEN